MKAFRFLKIIRLPRIANGKVHGYTNPSDDKRYHYLKHQDELSFLKNKISRLESIVNKEIKSNVEYQELVIKEFIYALLQ